MVLQVHQLELSLWKETCPPTPRIPESSIAHGYVNKDRYIITFGNVSFPLPLKWRPIIWIVTILQHHAMYHAGNGGEKHTFLSLVWFYDGLFQHLIQEASKHPSIPEDWSLPAWDRYIIRLRLGIGHSPLDLHLFQKQLAEAYVNQSLQWLECLYIILFNHGIELIVLIFHLRFASNHRKQFQGMEMGTVNSCNAKLSTWTPCRHPNNADMGGFTI